MKKKKIIIVTPRFPFPLEKGDKLRIYHQIKYISTYHEIHLIALTEKKVTYKNINELKKFCTKIHIVKINMMDRLWNTMIAFLKKEPLQVGYFYSKKAHKKITQIINQTQPEWCYSQLIRTAKYLRQYDNNIIDYMDAFSKGLERRVQHFPIIIQPIIKREAMITRKFEESIFQDFRHHTIITKNDRQHIHHIQKEKIHIIKNGVDTQYYKPVNKTKEYDIVFVGNMNYPPNINAVLYLCKYILPIIEHEYRKCNILIGGATPNKKVLNLKSDNICISGWVKDIREIYAAGKIFVAPMFIGTGLQNKLLEAMAMGLPCITTKFANNALLANSSQIIIANNPKEFAINCIELLNNNIKAEKLKQEGLKFVREKYDWKKVNERLNLILK